MKANQNETYAKSLNFFAAFRENQNNQNSSLNINEMFDTIYTLFFRYAVQEGALWGIAIIIALILS